ncbi:hypothetical protein L596_029755 [Steinernema carpocapsae]|uniref:Uncharacterized protein n=1 Tax=Steinernema carpocapsae TaxID=34508 RepID=A0A4U5LQQ2_STECR|nr:hypothetical protein L596_029755 [Steinernema carpocapsae]
MEGLLRIGHKSLKFVQNFVRSKAVLCFLVLLFAFYVFYCTPVVFFEPKGVGYSILNSTLNATLNSNFNATQRKHLSLFGAIHVELDKPKTPHVWLLLGAHRDTENVTFACYSTNRNGDVRETAVGISPLHPAPMQCLWIVYRAKCDVVDDMTEFRIADGGVDAEFRGEKVGV